MRKSMNVLVVACMGFASLAAQLAERRIDFENDEVGKSPRFVTPAVTGDAKEGKWVVEEADAPPSGKRVLAQRDADKAEDRFALCVADGDRAPDADVEVRMNALAGDVDRAGGVVARYIDRNNYYLARADARAGNVRLYAVVQGKLTQLAGQPVAVDPHTWHKLRLVVTGRHLQAYFNDVLVCEADDDAHRDAGQVGLWTKADSVVLFDDLVIKPIAKAGESK